MNKIRFGIDSSPSAILRGLLSAFTKLGRMIDFNGEKNVSNGRKSGDR
jgi:hypothetical protein